MQFRLITNKSKTEIYGAEWQKNAEIVDKNEAGSFDYDEQRRTRTRSSSNSEPLLEVYASEYWIEDQ